MEEPDPFTYDESTGRRLWRGHNVERPVYTDPQALAAEIARRDAKIVGVDGHDGSGKSFLGRQISMALNAQVFETGLPAHQEKRGRLSSKSRSWESRQGRYLPNLICHR